MVRYNRYMYIGLVSQLGGLKGKSLEASGEGALERTLSSVGRSHMLLPVEGLENGGK